MPIQVRIGIAIAIVAALGVMGWLLHSTVRENGKLQSSLNHARDELTKAAMEANEAAANARQDIAARDAATAEAKDRAAENAAKAATLAKQLAEARANADLSACLDMRLPDSVRLP